MKLLYNQGLFDPDRPSEDTPYPYILPPGYYDAYPSAGYAVYQLNDRASLAMYMYPYMLDSVSFPWMITQIATRMDSSCIVEYDPGTHWMRKITLNGETHYYGGAGKGGKNPVFKNQIAYWFRFNGASDDLAQNLTVEDMEAVLWEYTAIGNRNVEEMEDLIQGNTFTQTIGSGSWLRVRGANGVDYTYYACGARGKACSLKNTWVDGRFINGLSKLELNATFDDHPKASIVLRNVRYKDYYGNEHSNDIVYDYDTKQGRGTTHGDPSPWVSPSHCFIRPVSRQPSQLQSVRRPALPVPQPVFS